MKIRASKQYRRRGPIGHILFAAAMALSLSSAVAGESKRDLLSLRLGPGDVTLWGAGASQQLLVLGKYSDGLERDVTSQSRFSVSDSKLAKLDDCGKVSALADGEVIVTAQFNGKAAKATIRITGSEEKRPFSFARDIGGILTKRGCNTNDCHGSVKGKGGLKFSANALYPKEDYRWIVKGGTYQVLTAESGGPETPRIDLKEPENSLLLLKPTMKVAHGGGLKFGADAADYQTILKWIQNGAPYGEENTGGSVRVVSIDVFPAVSVLDAQGSQQLLVTAHLSHGKREDITEQVLYASNNNDVVEVTPEGLVEAVNPGETAVMIRAAGHAISAGFGVITKPIANYPDLPRENLIDDYVFAKLRKFNIVPSELSSDAEFLRRACLDVTGTLPPPERVREFLGGTDPQKRDNLIEILLESPEYVDYWTYRFTDLFRVAYVAQGSPKYTEMYYEWVRDVIARNAPYDQIARERIAAQGYNGATRHYYHIGGELPTPANMMAEQLRIFHGRRLDCAQCHNHPYENWSQDQFWGMAAFFGRLTRLGQLGKDMVIIDDPAGHGEFGQGEKVIHPRTKQEVEPKTRDGKVLPEGRRTDPRGELADWIISHPYFTEAVVNRMWGYFFGRGFVDPVDDFRLTNPPSHPGLLKALGEDFKKNSYDLKHLIRRIVRSRTYQLSQTPNETNRDDKTIYSRALPRPLDAEVLLDAISHATGVEEQFDNWMGGKEPPGTRAIQFVFPDTIPSQFLDLYGRPSWLMVPQRKVDANLGQGLHLLAGGTYTAKLSQEGSRIDRLLKSGASNQEIIEELYLAALSRYPTALERDQLETVIAQRSSRREALEDFLWGMIASREFAFNH